MPTKTQQSLGDRVYALLEDGEVPAACSAEPKGVHATLRESHMQDWGMVFGIAYGLAAAENPSKDGSELGKEALNAARSAYGRWAGLNFPPRPSLSPLVDDVLAAFNAADTELMFAVHGTGSIQGSKRVQALSERLDRLGEAVGVPDDWRAE